LELEGFQMVLATLNEGIRFGDIKLPILLARALEDVLAETEEMYRREIDETKLELDARRQSGYAGVFTHGTKYQARVPNESGVGTQVLDTAFKDAITAAWERRKWMLARKLPYGAHERAIMAIRFAMPTYSHELAYRLAIHEAAKHGQPFDDLSPEDRAWERYDPFAYPEGAPLPPALRKLTEDEVQRAKEANETTMSLMQQERAMFDALYPEQQAHYLATKKAALADNQPWDFRLFTAATPPTPVSTRPKLVGAKPTPEEAAEIVRRATATYDQWADASDDDADA
jgi:hypothetical protein